MPIRARILHKAYVLCHAGDDPKQTKTIALRMLIVYDANRYHLGNMFAPVSAQALPAGFEFQNSPDGLSLPSLIGIAVVHAGVLFGLATADRSRPTEVVPPVVTMQVEMISPTPAMPVAPVRTAEPVTPPPPLKRETPRPKRPAAKTPAPSQKASEVIAAPAAVAAADSPVTHVQEAASAPTEAAAPASSTPVETTQARFDASYLKNPAPAYPAMSRRLGEEGRVVLRVFVDTEGKPEKVELKSSSGFPRLDQSAEDAVRRWKFVPAKRGDETVATWVAVPIAFNLRS